jgi:hypothetical protein
MPLWTILVLLALVKVPLAALMLWIPFRSDEAMNARRDTPAGAESEDDGGSKALPGGPGDPHPRHPSPLRPRRGPHGSVPASPSRVRSAGRRPLVRER